MSRYLFRCGRNPVKLTAAATSTEWTVRNRPPRGTRHQPHAKRNGRRSCHPQTGPCHYGIWSYIDPGRRTAGKRGRRCVSRSLTSWIGCRARPLPSGRPSPPCAPLRTRGGGSPARLRFRLTLPLYMESIARFLAQAAGPGGRAMPATTAAFSHPCGHAINPMPSGNGWSLGRGAAVKDDGAATGSRFSAER
jgi:hypothetical protein